MADYGTMRVRETTREQVEAIAKERGQVFSEVLARAVNAAHNEWKAEVEKRDGKARKS